MKYHFLADFIPQLMNLKGKKVSRLSCVTPRERLYRYLEHEKSEKNMAFSALARGYFLEIDNYYTLAFRGARDGYRSLMVSQLERFPREEEIIADMSTKDPIIIDADDPIYANPTIKHILQTIIIDVDIAIYENPRYPYRRFNQRGIVITNNDNKKFTIFWGSLDQDHPNGMYFSASDYITEEFSKTYFF